MEPMRNRYTSVVDSHDAAPECLLLTITNGKLYATLMTTGMKNRLECREAK